MGCCKAFRDLGADITFLEAPESEDEMKQYCREVSGAKMANLIENGKTPILPYDQLQSMGYDIAVYPLSLLSASIKAMQETLGSIKTGNEPQNVLHFEALQAAVGFPEYNAGEDKYRINENKQ